MLIKQRQYIKAIDFANGNSQIMALEVKFINESVFITERNIILIGKIKAYMILGEFKRALSIINSFLNLPTAENKLDTYIFIRLLFLLVHSELGNMDVVENGIRPLKQYLKGKKRFFKFEESTISLLTELCTKYEKNERQEVWNKYKDKIIEFKKNPFEHNATINFDMTDWLATKV